MTPALDPNMLWKGCTAAPLLLIIPGGSATGIPEKRGFEAIASEFWCHGFSCFISVAPGQDGIGGSLKMTEWLKCQVQFAFGDAKCLPFVQDDVEDARKAFHRTFAETEFIQIPGADHGLTRGSNPILLRTLTQQMLSFVRRHIVLIT